MSEQGTCPTEDEMQAEEEIGRLQRVNAELSGVLDRVSQEKADLLAALKATMALWDKYGLGDDDRESESVYAQARAAIERAGR